MKCDVQNQTRHAWRGAGFGHCRHVDIVPGGSTIQHEHLVRKTTQMNMPWGLLKASYAPSLRVEKAKYES